jgi:outer membrane protein
MGKHSQKKKCYCALGLFLLAPLTLWAKEPILPNAPAVNLPAQTEPAVSPTAKSARPGIRLTREEAERMAIQHNPRVSVGRLLAIAQHQVVRETRSGELPALNGDLTGVKANEGSRLGGGELGASRLLDHAGAGLTLSQLITDFGRTNNLVASSDLREKAQSANAIATTEEIVLATDQAFYNALEAQALLKVARQTVNTRQTTQSQVSQLTKNHLKSTLDLSFANVNLSQARLMLLDATNNVKSSMAALDEVLGLDTDAQYQLVEENGQTPPLPPRDADGLIRLALQQRPDLRALNYQQQAAIKFSDAERDQTRPTIRALGVAGGTPVRSGTYFDASWYGAVGANVSVPIFNGDLFSSQEAEAKLEAKASAEQARQLRDRIVRDVRTSWLEANTAFQRLDVTAELLQQANLALRLANTRYNLGLSSIVELSQAQLQQTQSAIAQTNAQYQYRLSLATLNYETGALP